MHTISIGALKLNMKTFAYNFIHKHINKKILSATVKHIQSN